MNKELLLKIKKAILAEPRRLRMEHWAGTNDSIAPCGTTGCIAGFAIAINKTKRIKIPTKLWQKAGEEICNAWNSEIWSPGEKAAEILELNEFQRQNLFHVDHWPDKFRESYYRTNSRKRMATITARRIDHFIKHEA